VTFIVVERTAEDAAVRPPAERMVVAARRRHLPCGDPIGRHRSQLAIQRVILVDEPAAVGAPDRRADDAVEGHPDRRPPIGVIDPHVAPDHQRHPLSIGSNPRGARPAQRIAGEGFHFAPIAIDPHGNAGDPFGAAIRQHTVAGRRDRCNRRRTVTNSTDAIRDRHGIAR
jgi:hypothetical protein